MNIRFILACFVGLFGSGCVMGPLHQLNYSGVLPKGVDVDIASFEAYSSRLADRANLERGSIDRGQFPGDAISVELKSKSPTRILVVVMASSRTHSMGIDISGRIESSEAQKIAEIASQIFSELFPGCKLEKYSRQQGILGP